MSPTERSRADTRRRLVRHLEHHGDRFPPPCACGCGEPTRMGAKGFQKYLNRAHQQWGNTPSLRANCSNPLPDGIPIEQFRAAIRKIKTAKGWSYAECAQRGGQQPGWLHCYMFDKRYHNIGRETATAFLGRLAGLSGEATRHERRTAATHTARTEAAIVDIGVDPEPNTYEIPLRGSRKKP